ncbi:uncharacterized protein LOC128221202 [Mya arenaria]|uniref:uncharacterized protein LOC128221202 n=1 Tax=Mya arenaria TaxID=6604 RepID=UPI0022E486DF|nr:uncharacterized protein LOC128221202 [Mya arenaria]
MRGSNNYLCSSKVSVLCIFLLCVFVLTTIYNQEEPNNMFRKTFEYVVHGKNVKDEQNVSDPLYGKQVSISENVRIFDITSNAIAYLNNCTKAIQRIPDGSTTPICVHKGDLFVSAEIVKTGWWERGNIQRVWDLMSPIKDMQFLDLGCNIGAFTIPIAKLGRRVTAVDANRVNLKMLATSLRLGGLDENVTLIWNGLSNKTMYVDLITGIENVGGAHIVSSTEQDPEDRENTVITVRLDDMLSMFEEKPFFVKMDIEMTEALALQGAVAFFKEFDVRYVLMEWMHFKTKHPNDGEFIIDFLNQRSFTPFVPQDMKGLQLKDAHTTWPVEVLWMRIIKSGTG